MVVVVLEDSVVIVLEGGVRSTACGSLTFSIKGMLKQAGVRVYMFPPFPPVLQTNICISLGRGTTSFTAQTPLMRGKGPRGSMKYVNTWQS
jgi:hypothetical protein